MSTRSGNLLPQWELNVENLSPIDENHSSDWSGGANLRQDDRTKRSNDQGAFPSINDRSGVERQQQLQQLQQQQQQKLELQQQQRNLHLQKIQNENKQLEEACAELEVILVELELDRDLYSKNSFEAMHNLQTVIKSLESHNKKVQKRCDDLELKVGRMRKDKLSKQSKIDKLSQMLQGRPQ